MTLPPAEVEQLDPIEEAPSDLVFYVLVAFLILVGTAFGIVLGIATARLW